jgi:hypothetical protein
MALFPCPYLGVQVEWIITAYLARKLVEGEVEWQKS